MWVEEDDKTDEQLKQKVKHDGVSQWDLWDNDAGKKQRAA